MEKTLMQKFSALEKAAAHVIEYADNTGCTEDLTVVDAEAVRELAEALAALRE